MTTPGTRFARWRHNQFTQWRQNRLTQWRPNRWQAPLLILWLLLNAFLLFHQGIYLQGESAKYLYQAGYLLTHHTPESGNFWLYIVEISLIAACLKFHLSLYCVIALQLLVNLIATTFFYQTLKSLFKDGRTAFIGTLFLLGNYFYQEFNTFLYTESLFYSLTLILSCYLLNIRTQKAITTKNLITILALLTAVSFTRPTGLLFIPPAFLYLFLVFFKDRSLTQKLILLTAIAIGFLFLLNMALGSGGELDLMLPFRDENIICGVPNLGRTATPIDTTQNGNSLYGLFYYAAHNTSQLLRLAIKKTGAFFGLYRSYFGTGHNIYLLVYFNLIHLLALLSLRRWLRYNPAIFYYLLATIGIFWFTVMLTCDDWHNRFYLAISPFLILLAMPAISPSDTSSHTRY